MIAKFPCLFFAALLIFLTLPPSSASSAHPEGYGYQGVEFSGSSQVTRLELERFLSLKPGAGVEVADKAIERLSAKLALKHIKASVDIAQEGDGYFIAVDVVDPTVVGVPSRRLTFPHHVALTSEKPFSVLEQLMERRRQLAEEGRPVSESYKDGLKYFSDEPCNFYAQELHKQVPSMLMEFFSVISSDPDPRRRSQAIEVLNWVEDPVRISANLIAALNDADEQVRASAARYIFPRLNLLPESFPVNDLVEAFSNQMLRQTHQDRVMALRCLLELARQRPETIHAIKAFDEDRIKQIYSASVLTVIRSPAEQILKLCANPPPIKHKPKPVAEEPNF